MVNKGALDKLKGTTWEVKLMFTGTQGLGLTGVSLISRSVRGWLKMAYMKMTDQVTVLEIAAHVVRITFPVVINSI